MPSRARLRHRTDHTDVVTEGLGVVKQLGPPFRALVRLRMRGVLFGALFASSVPSGIHAVLDRTRSALRVKELKGAADGLAVLEGDVNTKGQDIELSTKGLSTKFRRRSAV
jgi:hypothetical protein